MGTDYRGTFVAALAVLRAPPAPLLEDARFLARAYDRPVLECLVLRASAPSMGKVLRLIEAATWSSSPQPPRCTFTACGDGSYRDGGPRVPRISDGRCVWCERRLPRPSLRLIRTPRLRVVPQLASTPGRS